MEYVLQGCGVIRPDQVQSTVACPAFTSMGGNSRGGEELKCLGGQPFLDSIHVVGGGPARRGPCPRVEIEVSD